MNLLQAYLPSNLLLIFYRLYVSRVGYLRRVREMAYMYAILTFAVLAMQLVMPLQNPSKPEPVAQAASNLPVVPTVEKSVVPAVDTPVAPPAEPPAAPVISRSETVNKQLQPVIDEWVRSHPGTFAVTVRGIDDTAISAHYRGGEKMYTASIYKMFAIELAYDKVNKGQWSANQGGLDIDQCVRQMIVVSDNNCAVAFGNMLGWQSVDGELRAKGYKGTSLNINHPWSTSDDVSTLMVRLQQGGLVNSAQRESMLQYMKQQIHRRGIPAGNPGLDVANKVGFFDSYNTDAGVVYSPKGAYVLSIMTNGSNFAAIADLSAKIAAVMNQ